jgi:hypothetical protein
MAQPLSSPRDIASAPQAGRVGMRAAAGAILAAAVVLGTLVLWAHYGTAVFFDMITSGLAACL